VAFLKPVLCGDTLQATGRLTETVEAGAMLRRTYALVCENQHGELVTSATAAVLVAR
jgi:acyl dehydratase